MAVQGWADGHLVVAGVDDRITRLGERYPIVLVLPPTRAACQCELRRVQRAQLLRGEVAAQAVELQERHLLSAAQLAQCTFKERKVRKKERRRCRE